MISHILVFFLRVYKKTLSPLLGPRCRFYPSCSDYACECLQTYSLAKALSKISWRVVRCNPLHPGGVDLP